MGRKINARFRAKANENWKEKDGCYIQRREDNAHDGMQEGSTWRLRTKAVSSGHKS